MVEKFVAGENKVNQKRQADAIERIKKAMKELKSSGSDLPSRVGEMKELLSSTIKKLFDIRPSDKTLNKYRNLWHPKYTEKK